MLCMGWIVHCAVSEGLGNGAPSPHQAFAYSTMYRTLLPLVCKGDYPRAYTTVEGLHCTRECTHLGDWVGDYVRLRSQHSAP
jgi:hypothetical protein